MRTVLGNGQNRVTFSATAPDMLGPSRRLNRSVFKHIIGKTTIRKNQRRYYGGQNNRSGRGDGCAGRRTGASNPE